MKTQVWVLVLGQVISIALSRHGVAQVVPDQTLPVGERSQVSGDLNSQINGGAIRGSNLFHSFQQFSIPTGGSASFNNAPSITNIITRVTGSNLSNIDGLIRANGTANLFLINPSGILFGANARLELGGSFVASTAESLKFANGFEFSATSPQVPPLLTISVPIGLQYGSRSGEVRVQGATLQVPNGQTLALAGGNVAVDGGQLLAPGGRVALGGISEAGTVGLNLDGSLSFPDSIARADVVLTNGALVDVAAGGGGEIAISARNLDLSGGSRLRAGIGAGLGTAQAQAGKITLQAAEDITLQDSFVENSIASGGIGKGGDIGIDARSLFLTNSPVSASTNSEGAGGNLTLKATDLIQIIGSSAIPRPWFGSGLFAQANEGSRGNAGDLSIETRSLIVRDGAQVSSGTFGEGAGGNLTVKATDSVQLIGSSADGGLGSSLDAQTDSRGNAGNLSIETRNLVVRDGSGVSTTTFGEGSGGNLTVKATDSIQLIGTTAITRFGSNLAASAVSRGNAGNLSIDTGTLLVRDGAFVSNGTRGSGAGGNLTVNAADSIQVIGTSADARFPDGQSPSTLIAGTSAGGNAGDITLKTRQLMIEDGGRISSRQGTAMATGNVGNISIEARSLSVGNNASITVEYRSTSVNRQRTRSVGNINIQTNALKVDRGLISAATASTNSGNIDLGVQDVLLLRSGGRISTNAGTAQSGGNGGNITFNGNFIVAVPQENSNITANAFSGRGGNIRINTQGLFGIQPRTSTTTGLSSITASSQFGIRGTIVLNTPDIDPSRGTATLPTGVIDINVLIASSCVARRSRQGRFVITGTGGLAPQPDDLANAAFPTYELVPQPPSQSATSVTEADQIYRLPTGEIALGRSCQ